MKSIRVRWLMVLALMLAASSSLPAQKLATHRSKLELVVLGSGGPRSFGRASTSYLVLVENVPRILVDAGPGAFQAVGRLGLNLEKVDIILLTHLHIDHSADLPAIFLDRSLTSDGPVIFKVFGPHGGGLFPDTSQFVQRLLGPGGAYDYQKTFGVDEKIEVTDLATALDSPASEIVKEGDLQVMEIATHHDDCPSVAYRVNYKGESITFSGDMDSSALGNLESLAMNSDLLVFHAAVLDPPGSPEILYTLHTAPRLIGQAAEKAGVKHLLLSHIAPDIEENQRGVLRSVSASYRGPITFAHDGMRVPVARANLNADPHTEKNK